MNDAPFVAELIRTARGVALATGNPGERPDGPSEINAVRPPSPGEGERSEIVAALVESLGA